MTEARAGWRAGRGRSRTGAALSLLALTVATAVGAGAGSAAADPSVADARARANAIAAQVQTLQVQTEIAAEHYNAVEEQLATVVTRYITATQQVGNLAAAEEALRVRRVQRIRALYMAGGQLGLYAQALDGNDISQVMSQLTIVGHVLASDARDITAGATRVRLATADQARLDQLATQRTELQVQAQRASYHVLQLLAERRAQLSSADDLVLRLVAEEEQRQAEAAAAAAARVLGTSPLPPVTLPPGTPAQVVAAIAAARSRLGLPYVWGATGPASFDCSGLTQWSYAHAGVVLPRTAAEQWWSGPHPSLDQLQPGDLLFYATDPLDPASIHHVTLYIGQGYMIEAPHTGAVVHVTPVYLDGYFGATRPVA